MPERQSEKEGTFLLFLSRFRYYSTNSFIDIINKFNFFNIGYKKEGLPSGSPSFMLCKDHLQTT